MMMYGYSEREKQVLDTLINSKPANSAYNDAKNRVADIKRGF